MSSRDNFDVADPKMSIHELTRGTAQSAVLKRGTGEWQQLAWVG